MTVRCLMLAGLVWCMGSTAKADLILSLVPTGPTSVAQGSNVTIQLVASDPGGAELGTLNWTGFNALLTADSADPNDAAVATVNGFGFSVSNTAAFDTGLGRTVGGSTLAPFASTDPYVLGQFSYVADIVGTTTFSFNNSNPGFNELSLGTAFNTTNGLSLVGTAVTVTAVPEPTALGGLSVLLLGGVLRRRRTA